MNEKKFADKILQSKFDLSNSKVSPLWAEVGTVA